MLRNDEPDSFADENVGRFWDNEATIPYMIARYNLTHAFLRSRSLDAVQAASDNCREMLRLNRADHMRIRDRYPYLLLKLGQDQKCYGFIRWWAVTNPDNNHDWASPSLLSKAQTCTKKLITFVSFS
jgi:hypothetical protein